MIMKSSSATTFSPASSGRNSYLKINICQRPYLEGLYNLTASIQGRLDRALQDHIDQGNSPPLQTRRFKTPRGYKLKVPPPLQIIPRPLSSLHLTLFFAGTVLTSKDCSDEELMYFYEKITHRLAQSGFFPTSHTDKTLLKEHSPDSGKYWLHVKELTVFPPQGKSLIVAQLEASLAYHRLWNDLQEIARNVMSQWKRSSHATTHPTTKSAIHAFMNTPSQNRFSKWIPHITVATIQNSMGGQRAEEKILQQVLKKLSEVYYKNNEYPIQGMECHSISIGGPIPQLKNHNDGPLLNWEYQRCNIRHVAPRILPEP